MIQVRFHGRGGQGIKTASQILGSAAFLSGFQAQDFPLYGAERRGAPIVAFTRISPTPILERGPISNPNLLLIGDETLLNDAQVAPLCGADESTLVFVNSTKSIDQIQEQFPFPATPLLLNLTDRCQNFLGKGHILSTALATAGARILGNIELKDLREAVQLELAQSLKPETLQKNLELTQDIFHSLSPCTIPERTTKALTSSSLLKLKQTPVHEAAPIILAPGNMALRKTGNWRMDRPKIDYDHCNKCLICYARCPEGTIEIDQDGRPQIDYEHCKGCMICAQECPGHFIQTIRESEGANG